jgi:hypothetical protein
MYTQQRKYSLCKSVSSSDKHKALHYVNVILCMLYEL